MKKSLLLLLMLYCACQPRHKSEASPTDCSRFKRGTFFYESKGDPNLYKFERADSIQKEIIGKSGGFVNLKINWTGPCTYELTFLDQQITGIDSVAESLKKTLKVKVEITKVQNDTCFIIADNGSDRIPGIIYIDKR